jgi:hypothetical protein
VIAGNYIGVGTNGTTPVGNRIGVLINGTQPNGTTNTMIGGLTAAAGNVIAGNSSTAIVV